MKMKMSLVLVQLFATSLVCMYCGVVDSTFVHAVQLKPSNSKCYFKDGKFYVNRLINSSVYRAENSLWKATQKEGQPKSYVLQEYDSYTGAEIKDGRQLVVSSEGPIIDAIDLTSLAFSKCSHFHLTAYTDNAIKEIGKIYRKRGSISDDESSIHHIPAGSVWIVTGIEHDANFYNARSILRSLKNGKRASETPELLTSFGWKLLVKKGDVYKVDQNERDAWVVEEIDVEEFAAEKPRTQLDQMNADNVVLKKYMENGVYLKMQEKKKPVSISDLIDPEKWKKIEIGLVDTAVLMGAFGGFKDQATGIYKVPFKAKERRTKVFGISIFLCILIIFIVLGMCIGLQAGDARTGAFIGAGAGTYVGGVGAMLALDKLNSLDNNGKYVTEYQSTASAPV